jgi:tetratricopeptide (TPR) repeat protein
LIDTESDLEGFDASHAPSLSDQVSATAGGQPSQVEGSGFEFRDSAGLDWNKYQTGALLDNGFVTVPEGTPGNGTSGENGSGFLHSSPESSEFRFGGSLVTEADNQNGATGAEVFTSASLLPSDTMPRVLRDELEGIDFYIAQGYVEIAKDTLDRLRDENGDHPEILARYKRLGESFESSGRQRAVDATETPDDESFVDVGSHDEQSSDHMDYQYPQLELAVGEDDSKTPDYARIEPDYTAKDDTEDEDKPIIIQSESGPLYPDLLVQLNTSELQMPSDQFLSGEQQFQPTIENESREEHESIVMEQPDAEEEVFLTQTPAERVGTGDLLASLVSGIDASFDEYQDRGEEPIIDHADALVDSVVEDESIQPKMSEATLTPTVEDVVQKPEFDELRSARDELQEIFDELKGQTGDLKELIDFETHYSLGLAYKDMELLDEAISEFQMAFRTAGVEDLEGDCINCCNMLGVCFKQKQIPKVAIMWFERGLKIPNRAEDEYQALRYEIGVCYEEMGEIDKAIEAFTQVYGIDVNYRRVGDKIKELQAVTA